MAAQQDPSLLLKCEDFLVHPTVRTLSLAQRVDFLEKKGLSPEEITQCLTSVDRRNGLSQLARCTAEDVGSSVNVCSLKTPEAAGTKSFEVLQVLVKKYGVVTLLLAVFGYGYVHFRQRKTEQRLRQREMEQTQRKKRLHTRVAALLAVVKHQQMQYNQAVELLGTRVMNVRAAENATIDRRTMVEASLSVPQLSREWELQALQSELMELKSAVVDTYLHPPAVTKSVKAKKQMPMLLRPSTTCKGDWVVQENAVTRQRVEDAKSVGAPDTTAKQARQIASNPQKKQSNIRDQTSMTFEEITALFERGQVEEELSTAGSYRLLFAT